MQPSAPSKPWIAEKTREPVQDRIVQRRSLFAERGQLGQAKMAENFAVSCDGVSTVLADPRRTACPSGVEGSV